MKSCAERVNILRKIAYFNNAATTFPKPDEVYEFMDNYYRNSGINSGRSKNSLPKKLIQDTRKLLLDLLHCPAKKIVFTPTATEAINVILQGLSLSNNFTVYISPFEHNAVLRTLNFLQTLYKMKINILSVNEKELTYDLERIKNQFAEEKPNILIMSHASNVCGVVAPIHDICTMAHKYGSINIIDMCQTAGLIDTDLSSDIYDFTVFSGHKTLYAPFGIAGFVCSGDILLKPLIYGGTGIDSANLTVPNTIPERYEVGSQNIMAMAGLYAALNWINKIGIDKIYEIENHNTNRLLSVLENYSNIRVVKPLISTKSIGVISSVFNGYSSDSIGKILSEQGIEARTGLHCAPLAHKFIGTFPSGTVRFSVGYFNNNDDFVRLDTALNYIYENS